MDSKKVIFVLACLTCLAFAQVKWERIFGGSGRDQAFSVTLARDGGYVVAGITASFPLKCYEMYAVKTNASGDPLWMHNFGTAFNDYCWSIAPARDSGYVLLGATDSVLQTGPHDVYLIRIDEDGDSLWARVYGDTGSGPTTNDVGRKIAPTDDGGYILIGSTESYGAGSQDMYLVKTDAAGDTQWIRTYGKSSYETGEAVDQTIDGGYIVAGSTDGSGNGQQIWILRIDRQGDTVWTRIYGGSGDENTTDIAQTPDRGFIFVGSTTSYGAGSSDLYLVKTDSAGNVDWTRTYGYQYADWGNALAITADSGYIIIGGTNPSPNPEECYAWLLKVDGNGDTTWTRMKNSAIGSANGMDVQQAADGGFIIAAITWETGGDDDFLLIKTDPEGLSIFEKQLDRDHALASRNPIAYPNPFVHFTTVPGHERECYQVFNAAGRLIGDYPGNRIGRDLPGGVYFLAPRSRVHDPLRIVKIQ